MARRNSLQSKIEQRIAKSRDGAFLTREFRDLGDERQVLRALSKLVAAGQLIRLGYGVYGRAERSELSGKPMLATGFGDASRVALTKLGVIWQPSPAEVAYNEGRSTQVPVNGAVRIKGRFARQLSYRGKALPVFRT